LSVSSLAIAASAGTAHAADQKKARDKIVDLNKQALLSYEAKDFEAAKELLTKALKEAKQANLEDDKMTARTYLHLGAVYFVGYQDQAVAIQNFTLAKKIRPDIQLTPSIETAELKVVFDQAVAEAEPTPTPEPTTRPSKAQPVTRPTPAATPELAGGGEPDLPSSMNAPLMCSTPEEAPPSKELTIRCAVKPGVNAKAVQLYLRAPGAEAYQALSMRRTAKGWWITTIPAHVMKGASIQVYYDARDGSDNEVATNGQIDSPSVIEIRKKGSSSGGGGGGGVAEGDPLEKIKRQQKTEEYESGLHRRREGAIWVNAGVGSGWGYAPGGGVEWAKDDQHRPIQVGYLTATTGLITVVAEVGYMVSDDFAVSLQGRLEYISQVQKYNVTRDGQPATWAPAALARGLWFFDVTSGGNFQFFGGPAAGYGYVRFPVVPGSKGTMPNPSDPTADPIPDPSKTLGKTDTRAMGALLFGPTGGLIVHLSRNFGVVLDARALMGLPNFGFAVETNLALQLAFGGKAGPVHEAEEGEGEDGSSGPVNDAPAPADSPGSSEEE
jgi:hypothetical protein